MCNDIIRKCQQWGRADTRIQSMNIGARIKARFDLEPKAHTVAWFARQLNCHRVNVYDIFRRNTIDTELLMRISVILRYDFFKDLSAQFEAEKERSEK